MRPFMIAALVAAGIALPVVASETAGLYRACAQLEREAGNHEREAVFTRAADFAGGGWRSLEDGRTPRPSTCLALWPRALQAAQGCKPHSVVCSGNVPDAAERSYPRG